MHLEVFDKVAVDQLFQDLGGKGGIVIFVGDEEDVAVLRRVHLQAVNDDSGSAGT